MLLYKFEQPMFDKLKAKLEADADDENAENIGNGIIALHLIVTRRAATRGGSRGHPPQTGFSQVFYSEKIDFFGQNSKFFAAAAPIGTAGNIFFI